MLLFCRHIWSIALSMRFAVFVLGIIVLFCVIGACVPQQKDIVWYVEKFGPFWAEIFCQWQIDRIYNSTGFIVSWFILFLCLTRCCLRKIIAFDFKEIFTAKIVSNLSFLFIHFSFILIGIGVLIDTDYPYQWMNKIPVIKNSSWLSNIHTIRSNLFLRQGEMTSPSDQDIDFPFKIRLDKFNILYYDTGMVKFYESILSFFSRSDQFLFSKSLKVNHPIQIDGFKIYQKGYTGDGSTIVFRVHDLYGNFSSDLISLTVNEDTKKIFLGESFYTVKGYQFDFDNYYDKSGSDSLDTETSESLNYTSENIGPSVFVKINNDKNISFNLKSYLNPITVDSRKYWINEKISLDYINNISWWIPVLDDLSLERFFYIYRQFNFIENHKIISCKILNNLLKNKGFYVFGGENIKRVIEKILLLFSQGGFQKIDWFIESKIPKVYQENIQKFFVYTLQSALESLLTEQEKASLTQDDRDAILISLSDGLFYNFSMFLEPVSYQAQYSVLLDINRLPGSFLVYTGFFMFFIGFLAKTYIKLSDICK